MHITSLPRRGLNLLLAVCLVVAGLTVVSATTDIDPLDLDAKAHAGNHPNWNNIKLAGCNAQHRHFYTPFGYTVYQIQAINGGCSYLKVEARHGSQTPAKSWSAPNGIPAGGYLEIVRAGHPANANTTATICTVASNSTACVAERYHS